MSNAWCTELPVSCSTNPGGRLLPTADSLPEQPASALRPLRPYDFSGKLSWLELQWLLCKHADGHLDPGLWSMLCIIAEAERSHPPGSICLFRVQYSADTLWGPPLCHPIYRGEGCHVDGLESRRGVKGKNQKWAQWVWSQAYTLFAIPALFLLPVCCSSHFLLPVCLEVCCLCCSFLFSLNFGEPPFST